MGSWKDRLGILASVVCAIHCAATPILLASLPTLKFTEWMAGPAFHQWAAAICTGLVAIAIVPSFLKSWDYRVMGLSLSGIGLIVAAAFFMPDTCCTKPLADCCCTQPLAAAGTLAPGADNDTPGQTHGHDHAGHEGHGHDHDGHSHAVAGHNHADSGDAEASDASVLSIAGVQPWLTPLGGVMLILAHALNLQYRRRDPSACCPTPSHAAEDCVPERVQACNVGMDGEREFARAS